MADDLGRDLYCLATDGDELAGVVVLEGPGGRWAPLFSTRGGAAGMAAAAPAGVRVTRAPAGDPRAREELLLACLANGAEVLAVDPGPAAAGGGPAAERVGSVRLALAAVRSRKTGTACL